MRVAVIGAGAMGSLACLLLCEAGMEAVVYELRGQRAAQIEERGILVRGDISGTAAPAVGKTGMPGAPYDLIVLAVGAGETGDALRPLSPFVHRDTIYLSLQDGNAAAALAVLVGEERAFAALARVSAFEKPDGEIEVEDFRLLVIGACVPGREGVIAPFVDAVEAVRPDRTFLAPDLEVEVWKRLESAAAVSGLCAVSGAIPQEAREARGLDRICEEAAEECRRVAASAGWENAEPGSPWEDAVWRAVKPPMLRDIEAGRKTEIAFMSGRIVEQAREAGLAVPLHSTLLTLVRELESGRHKPGEAALKELERRIDEERGMSLL